MECLKPQSVHTCIAFVCVYISLLFKFAFVSLGSRFYSYFVYLLTNMASFEKHRGRREEAARVSVCEGKDESRNEGRKCGNFNRKLSIQNLSQIHCCALAQQRRNMCANKASTIIEKITFNYYLRSNLRGSECDLCDEDDVRGDIFDARVCASDFHVCAPAREERNRKRQQ